MSRKNTLSHELHVFVQDLGIETNATTADGARSPGNADLAAYSIGELERLKFAVKRALKDAKTRKASTKEVKRLYRRYKQIKMRMEELTRDEAVAAFHAFDEDGNGNVNLAEFVAIGKALDPSIADAQLEAAFRRIDVDGDGCVFKDEFVDWWLNFVNPKEHAVSASIKRRFIQLRKQSLPPTAAAPALTVDVGDADHAPPNEATPSVPTNLRTLSGMTIADLQAKEAMLRERIETGRTQGVGPEKMTRYLVNLKRVQSQIMDRRMRDAVKSPMVAGGARPAFSDDTPVPALDGMDGLHTGTGAPPSADPLPVPAIALRAVHSVGAATPPTDADLQFDPAAPSLRYYFPFFADLYASDYLVVTVEEMALELILRKVLQPGYHDRELRRQLLMSHKSFVSTAELIGLLRQRFFCEPHPLHCPDAHLFAEHLRVPVQWDVVKFLNVWVAHFIGQLQDEEERFLALIHDMTRALSGTPSPRGQGAGGEGRGGQGQGASESSTADAVSDASDAMLAVAGDADTTSPATVLAEVRCLEALYRLMRDSNQFEYDKLFEEKGIGTQCPIPMVPRVAEISSVLELSPVELARQLTRMMFCAFLRLRPDDLLAPTENARVRQLTDLGDRLYDWTQTLIVMEGDVSRRAHIMAVLVDTAHCLWVLDNHHGALMMMRALSTSPDIVRLEATRAMLPAHSLQKLAMLSSHFDEAGNFQTYRVAMQQGQFQAPCIPYLGLHGSRMCPADLMRKQVDHRINVARLRIISKSVDDTLSYRRQLYAILQSPLIEDFFIRAMVLDRREVRARSLDIEPRGQAVSKRARIDYYDADVDACTKPVFYDPEEYELGDVEARRLAECPPSLLPEEGLAAIGCLVDLHPIELARQATLHMFGLFRNIQPIDYLAYVNVPDEAPAIVRLQTAHERLRSHTVASVLDSTMPEERARAVCVLIDAAHAMLDYRNFLGAHAVVAGLQDPAVQRLASTLERVPDPMLHTLSVLDRMFTNGYLNTVRTCRTPPVVPLVDFHLRQLRTLCDVKGVVTMENLTEHELAHRLITWLRSLGSFEYRFIPIVGVMRMLRQARHDASPQEAMARSQELEGTATKKKSYKNIPYRSVMSEPVESLVVIVQQLVSMRNRSGSRVIRVRQ